MQQKRVLLLKPLQIIQLSLFLAILPFIISPAQAQSIGNDQDVAVIVCKYRGTEDPPLSSDEWAFTLNSEVNGFYNRATNGQTTFDFDAVPGILEFDYSYEETAPGGDATTIPLGGLGGIFSQESDPIIMFREVEDAINFAEEQDPDIFTNVARVLVLVNRNKRARALPGIWPHTTQSGRTVFLSTALVFANPDCDPNFDPDCDDATVTTISHELGHQLGLPDLYRYNEIDPGPEYVGHWGQMGFDDHQNFSGYSRRGMGWLNTISQEVTINAPIFGLGSTENEVLI